MCLTHYEYSKNESGLAFYFESIGPKGKVPKVVRFVAHRTNGDTYFNLGFGDWNETEKKIDDSCVTNNCDREKVLATVMATVSEFLAQFPGMMVYVQGNTPSRTRLYQMRMAAKINDISALFNIYGLAKGQWAKFKRNRNYEAFAIGEIGVDATSSTETPGKALDVKRAATAC